MKPIIMSTEDVRSILDGRKTMLRRVMKPQPVITANGKPLDGYNDSMIKAAGDFPISQYQPGDILWVRETWFCEDCTPDCAGREDENECPFNRVGNACYGYKAQYLTGGDDIKWRPSIHMPREAARLFLRVVSVRVERVQEISAADAVREGIARGWGLNNVECFAGGCYNGDFDKSCALCDVPVEGFMELWNTRNAKRGYGWGSNPWIWVIEFERIEKGAES